MTKGQAFLGFLRKLGIEDEDDVFDFFNTMELHSDLIFDEFNGKQTSFVDPEDYDGSEEVDKNNPDYNQESNRYAVHCQGFEGGFCKRILCINCEYRNFWNEEFEEGEDK